MSVLGGNWRFLTISAGSASLVRGKTGWIRKPLFYPLNYGNNDSFDFRFSSADCNRTRDRSASSDTEANPKGLLAEINDREKETRLQCVACHPAISSKRSACPYNL